MIKKIALALLLTALPSFAATISVVRSGNGIIPTSNAGQLLSGGDFYIGVGTYAGGVAPTVTNEDTLKAAVASFKEFASALSPTSGTTAGTVTGSFVGSGGAPNKPEDFNSAPLFILIGNAKTLALSTEFAILQGTPTWNFVGDVTIGSASATISLIDSTAFASLYAGTEIDNASGKDSVRLMPVVPVPEASTGLFGLLAVGGLLSRRKR